MPDENLEEWRLRVYGKALMDDIEFKRRNPQAWRRRTGKRKKVATVDWLFPLLLLTAIFITAALTGDPDEPWFRFCPSCAFDAPVHDEQRTDD